MSERQTKSILHLHSRHRSAAGSRPLIPASRPEACAWSPWSAGGHGQSRESWPRGPAVWTLFPQFHRRPAALVPGSRSHAQLL